MDFLTAAKSDYDKIKHLLDTEKITDIEFTERDTDITFGNNNPKQSLVGGDNYSRIQEEGNRQAERMSDSRPDEYSVDEMRNDGSRRNRSIGYDLNNMRGGDGNETDSYTKDFFEIFNKAKQYQRRIMNVQNNMSGGKMDDDSDKFSSRNDRSSRSSRNFQNAEKSQDKKPKQLNDSMRLSLDVSKKIKDSNQYPEIPFKHLMQVAKLIITDAKDGSSNITLEVREKALDLASNPDKYVAKWKEQMMQKNSESQESSSKHSVRRSVRSNKSRLF